MGHGTRTPGFLDTEQVEDGRSTYRVKGLLDTAAMSAKDVEFKCGHAPWSSHSPMHLHLSDLTPVLSKVRTELIGFKGNTPEGYMVANIWADFTKLHPLS